MAQTPKLTEVTRSFSRKLNLGNYESADFFCSAKEECTVAEAEVTSRRIFSFCQREVYFNIRAFKAMQKAALEKANRGG